MDVNAFTNMQEHQRITHPWYTPLCMHLYGEHKLHTSGIHVDSLFKVGPEA